MMPLAYPLIQQPDVEVSRKKYARVLIYILKSVSKTRLAYLATKNKSYR